MFAPPLTVLPGSHFGTDIFLIYTGAAALATLALYARQTMIVAYIVVGILLGPVGAGLIKDHERIQGMSEIGIMFLLFLLGLNLSPVKLMRLLRSMTLVTGASSLLFGIVGTAFGVLWGIGTSDALILGATLMFSSTIIGLKLLPTTVLHHKHTGETIISILLLQDALAILVLLGIRIAGEDTSHIAAAIPLLALPLLAGGVYLVQKYVISRWFEKFDTIHEYLLLLAIGWSVGVAELAEFAGLSREIGAFIAGITLAANPIALYIAESLKPIRDFFLIIFFFSLGASVNFNMVAEVAVPALILTTLVLVLKPATFNFLLQMSGENRQCSLETGVRLGQGSEFSLLIAVLAVSTGVIAPQTATLIQTVVLLTFLVSPYLIVMQYPTPIGLTEKLRRD